MGRVKCQKLVTETTPWSYLVKLEHLHRAGHEKLCNVRHFLKKAFFGQMAADILGTEGPSPAGGK